MTETLGRSPELARKRRNADEAFIALLTVKLIANGAWIAAIPPWLTPVGLH